MLIPNAGVSGRVESLAEVDLAMWQRTLAVNLTAPFVLAARVLPGMAERNFGRLLFVSSVAAFTGGMVGSHYAASKSGLQRHAVLAGEPVRRLGTVDEVTQLSLTMLTNGYLAGKVYLLDGGMRAG